jgi:Flp pilus assembly pilin Flp
MRAMLAAFLRDRSGQTAIEYAMIIALMTLLIVSAMSGIGISVEKMFIPLEKAIAAPKV